MTDHLIYLWRLALVVVLALSACTSLDRIGGEIGHIRRVTHSLVCDDGWPVKILQDLRCRDGICGVTCAPDRWR